MTERDQALEGDDDQTPASTATGDETTDPSDDEAASPGDVGDESEEEGSDESAAADDDAPDAEPSDEDAEAGKPKSRTQERFSQLTAKNRELERKLIEAETRKQMLEEGYAPSKRDAPQKPKVDLSKYDPKKLEQAKELFTALGLGDVQQQVQSLQEELQRTRDEASKNADRSERQAAITKFKDIGITEDEILEQIEVWESDPNPRVKLRAQLPYEDIVRLMKSDAIAERDVDKTLKNRKKAAPKVDAPASKSEGKPSQKQDRWNPGDPDGSMDALKRRLLPSMVDGE